MKPSRPLAIDLDGTLTFTDTLYESFLKLLIKRPLDIFKLPFWLSKGKARFKNIVAQKVEINYKLLPYNHNLIEYLEKQKRAGRKLILCTAANSSIANKIAKYLGIFDEIMASDDVINLSGTSKAKALKARFGNKGFDYVGNSTDDLAVWKFAKKAIVVNASSSVKKKVEKVCDVEKVFAGPKQDITTFIKALRIHQWFKNILLFFPFFAAHQFVSLESWSSLIIAFLAFSLCASSVYIINDLFDLESDRQHSRKNTRPFASGQLPIYTGFILAPILLVSGFILASFIDGSFLPWLAFYFFLTCAYTLFFKRITLLDWIVLAILYTLRIISGAAAIDMALSFWILAFSFFLFLSLAFIKRFTELQNELLSMKQKINGRDYFASDTIVIQIFGITSGYIACLVLVLYLNSESILALYSFPEAIWAGVVIVVFWISRIWLCSHRGEMHDDPIIFALKDRPSLFSGALFCLVFYIGIVGPLW